ncbi:hypothetical protein Y032_0550g3311 [Ancylostoma ceylanicum]|uniref:Uncharacterized protein n=1 Tax=Ancylostoma ceylanicum TaxID=53326 RepID=A0A016WQ76_9BILA|nr:hypothetical protein Y032_0550g3311 [Ancylostoma ceylanicum]
MVKNHVHEPVIADEPLDSNANAPYQYLLAFSLPIPHLYFSRAFGLVQVANFSISVVRRGSNTYGDEMIVPSGGTGSQQPANVPEQPPSVVVQPPPAEEPKVVESGYRS